MNESRELAVHLAENSNKYDNLEKLTNISLRDSIVNMQDNELYPNGFEFDIRSDYLPFFLSLFGYKRILLATSMKQTLHEVENNKRNNKNLPQCVDDNKKVLALLNQYFLNDWTCLKIQFFRLYELLIPIRDTFTGMAIVSHRKCWIQMLCFMPKGLEKSRLNAKLATHGLKLVTYSMNFLHSIRSCQKDIAPFEKVASLILKNIKYCF
ncbi:hypothetical protein HHI36_011852 [Cryptolaemus montrouzieri]|uniref:Uncharacterized protein n=1 Tax=Cryptolaemus montrouzieri TaxID=559131 RepID=A0ABD2NCK3_9CUCU